ncbi:hypothetical protein BFP76_09200 [Amylibacter kogurei]|uniref:ABC transporter domain-containing protein n=1 Tax=Paramylibacter kogurei TaxID=1889778 RepID=A0A2G5K177_9RHOB|nr:ATP-binding cassette domain-containing protein [Amylibacter kogurei]PIB23185.1 hypothetical protein BFP76_09200 [Amylibacter kogurei]
MQIDDSNSLIKRAPELGQGLLHAIGIGNGEVKKLDETPPSWVRFIAGALGFFSSLLSLVLPAIVLLIVDRLIPADNQSSLSLLAALGVGIILSVCLIDLMRMRALENYFTNVRGLVLYQDSCFALFWVFCIAFIHPVLPLIPISVAMCLALLWTMRKPRKSSLVSQTRQQDLDPIIIDTVGLGPAYIQKTANGEIAGDLQPDFQTVGQSTWLNLVQLLSALLSVIAGAWLHIGGLLTLGTMIAFIFLNQTIVSVFIRNYQVQSLRASRPNLSLLHQSATHDQRLTGGRGSETDTMTMLSLDKIEDFGFAPFSADLFQGLCLTVIGPSGSGKSELLRAIATGQFFEGKMSYKDQNWGRNHGRLPAISYAPPTPVVLNGTIVENVTCFDPKARALDAIELVRKLDPYEDVFKEIDLLNEAANSSFSAQGQILSLARAFYRDKEIIILDTPETYLDKASRAALMALILKAKTEGKIVILSTDDEYLMSVADEVVKLERGEVTDRGPMDEVLARYHQRWVRVSFCPTKRDAFRLSLWLEGQFPMSMSQELKDRVKQTAQDMLFLAPRDKFLDAESEVLIDLRMNQSEVFITMHDKGDLLLSEQLTGEKRHEIERVENATDGFEQTLREGYRQMAARFHVDRVSPTKEVA